jgi:hypothetical protein
MTANHKPITEISQSASCQAKVLCLATALLKQLQQLIEYFLDETRAGQGNKKPTSVTAALPKLT